MLLIRVMHPGDTSYSEYEVDAIEIPHQDEVVISATHYGTVMIMPTGSIRGSLKDGLPK